MSDHDLEQIARTLARTDSREMILATSDESELHHVSDSGWRDWLPHAKALVADGHISSPAQGHPDGWTWRDYTGRPQIGFDHPGAMAEDPTPLYAGTLAEGARSGDVERLHRTIRFVLDKDEDLSQFTIDELTLALDETGYDPDAPSTSQSPAESEDKRPSEFWAGKASAAFVLAEEIKLRKQLTDALKALLEAVKAEPTMQGRHFVGLGIQVTNAISAAERAPRAWECMGRKQALPEPGECNWPDCGCDPHATKVIESLVEQGWTAGRSQPESSAQQVALAALQDWYGQANQLNSAKLYEACMDLFPTPEPGTLSAISISETELAEASGWALCDLAGGAGPAGCSLDNCTCGPEGRAVASALLSNFEVRRK